MDQGTLALINKLEVQIAELKSKQATQEQPQAPDLSQIRPGMKPEEKQAVMDAAREALGLK